MSPVHRRIEQQPAYVLHSHPWRETSLIVEVFSRGHGRLPLAAKGARRTASPLRGTLMSFQPLLLSWSGRNEVRTLTQAEWRGGQPLLCGTALLCGYYLNELLMRLLPRDDAHAALFDIYAGTLHRLSLGEPYGPLLRAFELALLRELGYAPALDVVAGSGEAVEAQGHYIVLPEQGVVPAAHSRDALVMSGRVLLDMARGDFSGADTLAQAKLLMRHLITQQLGGHALDTRRILMDLQEL